MFAMCSATDSFDIALAADGDICEPCLTAMKVNNPMNYSNSF
jgi:hypothetical protein